MTKKGQKLASKPAPPKRRVGFVLECQRDGAEHKILEHVVPALRPDIEPVYRFQINKGHLFRNCEAVVGTLFDVEKVSGVIVLWDLKPPEPYLLEKNKPSCKKEREHLHGKLREADKKRTALVCVTFEIEAWLLADGGAIKEGLSRKSHKIGHVSEEKDPAKNPSPKDTLDNICKNNGIGGGYDHLVHAARIIQAADLDKIARQVQSFRRLRDKLVSI